MTEKELLAAYKLRQDLLKIDKEIERILSEKTSDPIKRVAKRSAVEGLQQYKAKTIQHLKEDYNVIVEVV